MKVWEYEGVRAKENIILRQGGKRIVEKGGDIIWSKGILYDHIEYTVLGYRYIYGDNVYGMIIMYMYLCVYIGIGQYLYIGNVYMYR